LTKTKQILLCVGVIILGWLLNGFAWTTKFGHPINTIALELGIVLFFVGLILLIIVVIRK